MKDYLVKAISEKFNVRASTCITTSLVSKACSLHGTSPTVSAAFGRALSGALMMGSFLESGQRVALVFDGNGPAGKIMVEADSKCRVRGSVKNPEADIPFKNGKLDVCGAVGVDGFLTVTKDIGLKDPYKGVVGIRTGEIAMDIAYYLRESEQIPSAVGLGVFVEKDCSISASGGFLVQALPPSDDAAMDELAERLKMMPAVTELIRKGISPEGMLEAIFGPMSFKILETKPAFFKCSCSKERIEQALIVIGPEGLETAIKNEPEVEIKCGMCRKVYIIGRDEIKRLLNEMQ